MTVASPAPARRRFLSGFPSWPCARVIHRIERALANLGYERPTGRTIINLAPADLKKDAGSFDLPIDLGMLVAIASFSPSN